MRSFLAGAFASTCFAFALSAPVDVRAQARQDFTLINATGYQIDEVYVALSG